MIRFIAKLLLVVALVCGLEDIVLGRIEQGSDSFNTVNAGVYRAIKSSKQQHRAKRLVLGDSVCDQLYPGGVDNDSLCSLATNQGVTLAGYYFMVRNYLQANHPEEVVVLLHPNTLQNDVNKIAYNYFLKPFFTSEYKGLMNSHLMERIHSIPYYWMCQLPGVATTSYTPEYDITPVYPMSRLAEDYLDSISTCCRRHECGFRLVLAPISETVAKDYVTFDNDMTANECDNLARRMAQEAFGKIEVYPDSLYSDLNHFKRDCVPADYLGIN